MPDMYIRMWQYAKAGFQSYLILPCPSGFAGNNGPERT